MKILYKEDGEIKTLYGRIKRRGMFFEVVDECGFTLALIRDKSLLSLEEE